MPLSSCLFAWRAGFDNLRLLGENLKALYGISSRPGRSSHTSSGWPRVLARINLALGFFFSCFIKAFRSVHGRVKEINHSLEMHCNTCWVFKARQPILCTARVPDVY